MGELSEATSRYEALRSDDGLSAEIAELRDRVRRLEDEVDDASIGRRTDQALRSPHRDRERICRYRRTRRAGKILFRSAQQL